MPRCGAGRVGQRVVVRRRLPDGSATDVVGELLAVERGPAGWVLPRGTGRPGRGAAGRRGRGQGRAAPARPGRAAAPRPRRRRPRAGHGPALAGSRGRAAGHVAAALGRGVHEPRQLRARGRAARAPTWARPSRGRGRGTPRAVAPRWRRSRARSTRPRTPPSSPPSPEAFAADGWRVIPTAAPSSSRRRRPRSRLRPAWPRRIRRACASGSPPRRTPAGSGCTTTAGSRCRRSRRPCWSRRPSRRSCRCSTATAPWPWAGARWAADGQGSPRSRWMPGTAGAGSPGSCSPGWPPWAGERGARSTYVQVADTNAVARRLYESAGFAHHHRYDYLAHD